MTFAPYLGAAAISSALRIVERVLPIQNNSERYLDGDIDFQRATDPIVNNIRVYVSLTSVKMVCDVIVVSMTGKWIYDVLMHTRGIFKNLFGCGLRAFFDGMKGSFDFILVSLSTCSINAISNQFKGLLEMQKNSFSFMQFCAICNQIYFLIVASTCDLSRTVRLELVKYWLECMGIVRAVAEALNIDFVKYFARSLAKNTIPMDQFDDVPKVEWKLVKDPDFHRTIELSLEDLLHETQSEVKVVRQIRKIGKTKPEINEEVHTITIEPGCSDGKEFRCVEVGDQDPVNIPADLVVQIRTKPHPLYERMGADLIYKVSICLEEARNGVPFRVWLIDGEERELNVYNSANTKNKEIIVDHAGLPDPDNGGVRGRLIVRWDIELPEVRIGTESAEPFASDESTSSLNSITRQITP